ncbi:RecX family transcriptional regulator [Lachnoclostridium sp. An169]|uniref:regulatory protein RecX n=1 Tax=Lachnoclostridium sp. An169 TaxID=1965569 RepID=UPI000B398BFC|nr:regulatory protein RecX [Lachnoclostridium sp. An169]OUP86598.1 RecX family transcriptional regulator [Lachnoclostridium sp. An169]HJA67364.1 recombination regulator RecX [Candidatus Mediterraneibacter cottocaccae]
MRVTRTENVTKTKSRIFLDGEFAFVLYQGEMKRFGIREGADVPEETVRKIRNEVIFKRAKLRAMHLLSDMDRTESALREKLRQGLYPPDAVDAAVEYVRSFGYLDDDRFAENFVRSRIGTKSRKEILALLMQKGVSAEKAQLALEACSEEGGEEETVRRILKKKGFDPGTSDETQIRRICGYLARKGFRYDTVRQVIQNCSDEA